MHVCCGYVSHVHNDCTVQCVYIIDMNVQSCSYLYVLFCRKIKNAIIGNKMKKSSFTLLGVIPRSVAHVAFIYTCYRPISSCFGVHAVCSLACVPHDLHGIPIM